MKKTFEQGWAADPFKVQFPELEEKYAKELDDVNHAITTLLMSNMITDSQCHNIRTKRFPKLVSEYVNKAKDRINKLHS